MKPNLQRLAALGLSAALWGACAHAALFEDEEARRAILELRQTVRSQADDITQTRRVLLDLQGQIDALKAELASLRGDKEQLTRALSEVQMRQRDVQAGVDERLRRFEPTKVSLDGEEFMAEPAEKREFDAALETLRKGDFALARQSFGRFVQRYPLSGYLPAALFWLGNASYATKDYRDALAQFGQLLRQAPNHARAPEAMLAVANVQLELKDTKAARKALEDLIKAHPQSDAAQTAKERLAKLR